MNTKQLIQAKAASLLAISMMPLSALAQNEPHWQLYDMLQAQQQAQQQQQVAPIYGVPLQPVLPVPQDNGPWGTGYSIVTTTRPTRQWYDRDVTGSETVQRVVPNDALGRPQRGLGDLWP